MQKFKVIIIVSVPEELEYIDDDVAGQIILDENNSRLILESVESIEEI